MNALNATVEFLGAIQASLGHAPQYLEPGRFCRFGPNKSGWAKLFSDGLGGVFGDHRQNYSSHWSARQPRHQSPAELAAMRHHIELAAREREVGQRIQRAKNAERNARLWAASVPAGDAIRSYLAQRGLADWTIPSCIREHPALAYWHTDDDGVVQFLGRFHTMLAPIMRDGNLLAIHRTYLADGKKADVPTPKKLTASGSTNPP